MTMHASTLLIPPQFIHAPCQSTYPEPPIFFRRAFTAFPTAVFCSTARVIGCALSAPKTSMASSMSCIVGRDAMRHDVNQSGIHQREIGTSGTENGDAARQGGKNV